MPNGSNGTENGLRRRRWANPIAKTVFYFHGKSSGWILPNLMQVDIRESLGLFSRMYPQASRMVTTTREMQAGLGGTTRRCNIDDACLFQPTAMFIIFVPGPWFDLCGEGGRGGCEHEPELGRSSMHLQCWKTFDVSHVWYWGWFSFLSRKKPLQLYTFSSLMFLFFWLLRPAGKFLTTTHSRYLLGRECMLLQGMPVHRLDLTVCSERAP